jgi:predicted nucleic acid-binding protein
MRSAFTALIDACVLYSAPVRDIILELAGNGVYRVRWSQKILDEMKRNLIKNRPDLADSKLDRTIALMNKVSLDTMVSGYEALESGLTLPDPDDTHVLAAAITCQAGVIVTYNLDDFPESAVTPFNIDVQHPDMFLGHCYYLNPTGFLMAIKTIRGRLTNPPVSIEDYLIVLNKSRLPRTVALLHPHRNLL